VRIDLLPVVNEVLRQLEAQLPTLFGRRLNLPDVSSGEIPQNLRTIVEDSLGVTLPPNFAQFTIYRGDQLSELQAGVVMIRRGVFGVLVLALATLALGLWVSPNRRRTLLQLDLWLIIGLVVVTASIQAVKGQVLAQVPEGTYRTGVDAAITTIFTSLRDRGLLLLWLGVVLAAVAYLCGPGRGPTWPRHQVRSGARYAATGIGRGSRRGRRRSGVGARPPRRAPHRRPGGRRRRRVAAVLVDRPAGRRPRGPRRTRPAPLVEAQHGSGPVIPGSLSALPHHPSRVMRLVIAKPHTVCR
jgi:hypothetical protein